MTSQPSIHIDLINRLLPDSLPSIDTIEKKYPPRSLPSQAMVTRIAPSPTGFMHLGGLYAALISERMAHQSGGVFYLRIEDTDRKREVEGASGLIVQSLEKYKITMDEGFLFPEGSKGNYGPYRQSERESIYKVFIKNLLERGLAYPCFCTSEELEDMRKQQESMGSRTGYYLDWARWRNRTDQEIAKALDDGKSFVIRFKSPGNFSRKIQFHDVLRGNRESAENDQDIVIMKSDGLPTYHLAHVVDDHLMRTTHVIRGDEWFSSLPLHFQLFEAFGWTPPIYGHISPIQKMDGSSKRKLSKRKDPEANVAYYDEQGYPVDSVIEYLLNLANSNFEDWRKSNPKVNNNQFMVAFDRLSSSGGALFDFNKLNDVSKEVISHFTKDEVYQLSLEWMKKYNPEFGNLLEENTEYSKAIFDIERGNTTKVRKDFAKWSDIEKEISYFFDSRFSLSVSEILALLPNQNLEELKQIIESFQASYQVSDSHEQWFEKIKTIAIKHNYAVNAKEFKANPEKFRGNIADLTKIFRVLLAGRVQTPDLYSIMQVMGKERIWKRLNLE